MGEREVPAQAVHPGSAPDPSDRPADPGADERGPEAPTTGAAAVARARVSVAGAAVRPPAEDRPAAPATATTYRSGAPAEPAGPLERRQPGASVTPSTWSAFAAGERSATTPAPADPVGGGSPVGDGAPAAEAGVSPAPDAAGAAPAGTAGTPAPTPAGTATAPAATAPAPT
ncbi:hypothetical protein G3554_00855, partial [Micromonospora sp. PPF5-17]